MVGKQVILLLALIACAAAAPWRCTNHCDGATVCFGNRGQPYIAPPSICIGRPAPPCSGPATIYTPCSCPSPCPEPCPTPAPWPCPIPAPWPCPTPAPWPCPTPAPWPCPEPCPIPCPLPCPSPCPNPWPVPCPSPCDPCWPCY